MKQACHNRSRQRKEHQKKDMNLANNDGDYYCSNLQTYTNQMCEHNVSEGPSKQLRYIMIMGTAAGCKCPHGRTLVRCSAGGSQVGPWQCLGSAVGPSLVGFLMTSEQRSKLLPEPHWQGRELLLLRKPRALQHSRSCRSTCSPRLFDHSVQLQSAGEGTRL